MQINFTVNISAKSILKTIKKIFTKRNGLLLVVLTFLFVSILYAQQAINKPFAFGSGDTIIASEINANFDVLYNKINQIADQGVIELEDEVKKIEEQLNNNIEEIKKRVYQMESGFMPPGIIAMWSGDINSPPGGWAVCNGENGTPDLRDKFIVGASRNEDDPERAEMKYYVNQHLDTSTHKHNIEHEHQGRTENESGEHKHVWSQLTKFENDWSWQTYMGGNDLESLDGWWNIGAEMSDVPGGTFIPFARAGMTETEEYYTDSSPHTHSLNMSTTPGLQSDAAECEPVFHALVFIMKENEEE